MSYLIDSNIFVRIAQKNDPERQTALDALNNLSARGEDLCYTTQILAEFWNVCTRPTTSRGGLGLSLQETERKTRMIEKFFRLLPESLATHQEWRRLVISHSVSGVQVYDARLVAVMKVHSITHLLTFNGNDFNRFSGITVVDPNGVTSPAVN
jgi:predicted nucleic acid-binding protein